jgi:putative molybdopterin biosynthesis protein
MTSKENNTKKFYTIDEIAGLLKISYLTVFRWVKAEKITAYKIGKQYRIEEADLNKFLEKSKKYGKSKIQR